MFTKSVLIAINISVLLVFANAKIYDRCEFVREIYSYVPADQVPVWSCIAKHESNYNTAATNAGGDHGIIQINQQWWCSVDGTPGGACNARCSQFEDDAIADDFACANIIFAESERLNGNGFAAWTTYAPYCAGDVSEYVAGC